MITFTENLIYLKNEDENAVSYAYSKFYAVAVNRDYNKIHLFGYDEDGTDYTITAKKVTDEEYTAFFDFAEKHDFENLDIYKGVDPKRKSVWKISNGLWEEDSDSDSDSDDSES